MKKFFKKTEGFTLVELIVVIAILGILAGVGTVGYSGYIKKAQTAADNQLLAAVNQAYAAACIENGVDAKNTDAANITLNGGKVPGVDVTSPADKAEKIEAAFTKYFAGNENSKFKVATGLVFNKNIGAFVDPANSGQSMSIAYGGGYITLEPADIQAIQNSNIADMDPVALLNKVNDTAGMVTGLGAYTNGIMTGSDFLTYFGTLLGDDPTAAQDELVQRKLGLSDEEFATVERDDPEYLNALAQLSSNGMVLFTADATSKMDDADVSNFLTLMATEGAKDTLKTALTNTSDVEGMTTALTQTAMFYGLCTTYAQHVGKPELAANPTAALKLLEPTDENYVGFQEYLGSPDGQADLNGYIASLNTVSNSASDKDAVSTVLVNGFADPDLAAVLAAAMGK